MSLLAIRPGAIILELAAEELEAADLREEPRGVRVLLGAERPDAPGERGVLVEAALEHGACVQKLRAEAPVLCFC